MFFKNFFLQSAAIKLKLVINQILVMMMKTLKSSSFEYSVCVNPYVKCLQASSHSSYRSTPENKREFLSTFNPSTFAYAWGKETDWYRWLAMTKAKGWEVSAQKSGKHSGDPNWTLHHRTCQPGSQRKLMENRCSQLKSHCYI